MQDNNQMTPIKQYPKAQLNEESSNSLPLQSSALGNGILNGGGTSSILLGNSINANQLTSKALNNYYKSNDNQSDTIFCPMNDPIFQPTPSPNVFMDYKSSNNINNNPYFNSSFKASGMLASTKKPYNNNLFLTPIKEDDRRKPAYINSILKDSPYINGNAICRKLNFDDDFDDFNGNSLMPQSGIFEEKKGVFSNFNMNYLLMPQGQYYPTFYNQQFDFLNANINNMDFQGIGISKNHMTASVSANGSPENKKLNNGNPSDFMQNNRQSDLEGSTKKAIKQNARDGTQNEKNSTNKSDQNSISDFGLNNNNIFTQQGNPKKLVQQGSQNMLQQSNIQNAQASNAATSTAGAGSGGNTQGATFQSNSKKQKTCNCKKTKCLKLYCDCFAAGELCGGECNCFGCFNTSNSEKRAGAIVSIMDRQPDAFGPKVQSNSHKKGCNCTRSGCLKKYCECFTLGVNCGEYCKCTQCKNIHQNNPERPISSQNNNGMPPGQGIEFSQKVETSDKRQQQLDEFESKTSTKKKIFTNYESNRLLKNISSSNNEDQEDEEEEYEQEEQNQNKTKVNGYHDIEEEQEEEDNEEENNEQEDQEEDDDEEEQISPSQKMYTTPLKQPTKSDPRSLTTADTAKKTQVQDNDSEIKNRIVKLKITDTQSQKKKISQKSDKQNLQNTQGDAIQSNGSDEENHMNGNQAEKPMKNNKQNIPKSTKVSSKQ